MDEKSKKPQNSISKIENLEKKIEELQEKKTKKEFK